MQPPHYLTPSEQKNLLQQRGIIFSNNEAKDIQKIKEIGFYKIKEFAVIYLSKSMDSMPKYNNAYFGDILTRYYQDKNLRMHIFHASESIEVFLNNQISDLLGKKYDAFGYLEFKNWMDRKRFNKFEVEEKQYYFKKMLLRKTRISSLADMKDRNNLDREGFPTIWLMTDCLTFGDSVHIVENMSLKNKRQIASAFKCTPTELMSWLKCLNFIRNICAHNNDMIDISIITKPQPPKNYRKFLFSSYHQFTNKIAIAILIIKQVMEVINPKYSFYDIHHAFKRISNNDDKLAQALGFKSCKAIDSLISEKNSDDIHL